jgi:hypothetical protein
MTTTTVVIPGIWITVQSSATVNPANKLANRVRGYVRKYDSRVSC